MSEHAVKFHGAKPEIVVLCGSTRFKDDFERMNRDLGMQGKIVLSVSMFGHSGDLTPEQCTDGHPTKTALDDLHKRKIDLADSVLVINPDGYLGASTRSEIRYAWSVAHKPVDFMWHMPDEHHDGRSHGLCSHGEPRGTCPGVNSYDILETGPHEHIRSPYRDRTSCLLCGASLPRRLRAEATRLREKIDRLEAEVERQRARADHNAMAVNENADMIVALRRELSALRNEEAA